ncbi:hypothetical protein G9F72_006630 [Clostridium estertheticum]|uniref:uroporphyrinogen decarboxylase family protein n=1 Tax=Clostridium estertheticum TaxID=238834 RepID=UPI0013E90CFA|nr:uroporphyrinogen decarboxylase family protein [Clostridium estertheticum]MBZ9686009.1 hypothetical protein [Clostridium estertheticum]
MSFNPLTREVVKSVIEGRSTANRVPMIFNFWTDPRTFKSNEHKVADLLSKYPEDVQQICFNMPEVFDAPEDAPEYRWVNYSKPSSEGTVGLDAVIGISDWDSQLQGILDNFPDPNYKGIFPNNPEDDGRYRIGCWCFWLFERFWSLRGMTEALMDFYTYPENIHRLFRALTDFYIAVLERAKCELNLDGIFTTDDIGTQIGPFFSPEIFREFFKPYYKELVDKAHSLGMHFWLHTCGNIELFLPEFIEIGIDVIHPIQKYTMAEKNIVEKFGGNICFWAGFDVQQIIPWGTPDEVRQEVRFLMDTYYRPEGKFMITAGNGLTNDCKLESLEALLDECYHYGLNKGTIH